MLILAATGREGGQGGPGGREKGRARRQDGRHRQEEGRQEEVGLWPLLRQEEEEEVGDLWVSGGRLLGRGPLAFAWARSPRCVCIGLGLGSFRARGAVLCRLTSIRAAVHRASIPNSGTQDWGHMALPPRRSQTPVKCMLLYNHMLPPRYAPHYIPAMPSLPTLSIQSSSKLIPCSANMSLIFCATATCFSSPNPPGCVLSNCTISIHL